ncbi:MAG: hypothetical protein ACI35O_14005 [Bacillaceae bacterium]
MKKSYLILCIFAIFILSSCSKEEPIAESGISISQKQTSIGPVEENMNDMDKQSFKYKLTLTNHEENDLKIISLEPILSEEFKKTVLSDELTLTINKTISKNTSLEVSGEIIFNSKGLNKEQLSDMQTFIKEIKINEERIIK